MSIVHGDLIHLALAGRFDVIVHGCNCMHTMGAGIAKAIRAAFPEAWEADLSTPRGDPAKLGTLSVGHVLRDGLDLRVVNAYTQLDWRGAGVKADYEAIDRAFARIGRDFHGMRIGYPRIGAGLAGGNWDRIAAIIDRRLSGEDHTLVEFQPSPAKRPAI